MCGYQPFTGLKLEPSENKKRGGLWPYKSGATVECKE